jgi:hypothetical protein
MIASAISCDDFANAQLALTSRAAINGTYGVEIQQDGTNRDVFAATNKAAGREHLTLEWNIDLQYANVSTGQAMTIMKGSDQQGAKLFWVDLLGGASGLELRAYVMDGTSTMMSANVPVSAIHALEVEWVRDVDGFFRFEVDDVDYVALQNIDTDRTPFLMYFGAPDGMTGFSGRYYLDDVDINDPSGDWPKNLMVWIDEPYNVGVP